MGNAYNVMNSKACHADLVYAWPTAKIGAMNADSAVRIIYAEELKKAEDSSTVAANPDVFVNTRKYIIGAFEMLYTKKEERLTKKHGTV